MQGTIAVLMVLSGLGCHHKSCEMVAPSNCGYVAPYAGTGCMGGVYAAPMAINTGCCGGGYYGGYMGGCGGYSSGFGGGCLSGCYTAPVYPAPAIESWCAPMAGAVTCGSPCGGSRRGLFGGLFGCHRRAAVCAPPVSYGCAMPMVYGDYTTVPSIQSATPQAVTPGTATPVEAPKVSTPAAPEPAAPAAAPAAPEPAPAAATPPPPAPVTEPAPAPAAAPEAAAPAAPAPAAPAAP